MLPEQMIDEVKALFAGDSSGHDWAHVQRVMALTETLCAAEGGDRDLALTAALLHDVDDYKLTGGAPGATDRAEALMARHGYAPAAREAVCAIIRQISFKGRDSAAPDSPEGRIVQDADRLDAIGAVGVARTFAFGGAHGRPMYEPEVPPEPDVSAEVYFARKSNTINHFYEKLLLLKDRMNTPTARRMAEGRHRFMEGFLAEFFAEWEGER